MEESGDRERGKADDAAGECRGLDIDRDCDSDLDCDRAKALPERPSGVVRLYDDMALLARMAFS